MAKLIKRVWTSRGPTGHKVRRVAYGFTVQVNGKQERHTDAAWTKDDAENALAAFRLEKDTVRPTVPAVVTFGEAVDRYLKAKSRKKSIKDDERHLAALKAAFGADTPLREITAARISGWKAERLAAQCPRTKAPYSAAAINRPLAALRHLLHLAHEEWEVLPAVPRMRLEKEPQGRIRWLEADEETRLLDACRASKTRHLANIVTMALETGLRKAELLGLTWDRLDLSRGVIRLEITKSGKRREVPMGQAVYDVLASQPGPRQGRLWPSGKLRTAFEKAVETAKLDDFHFHDMRHHFASWFAMRGGDPPGPQGDPGPPGHQDDPPLRSPGSRPPPPGGGKDRASAGGDDQHKISTRRRGRGKI